VFTQLLSAGATTRLEMLHKAMIW